MPLDAFTETLGDGDRFRVAKQDEMVPIFELWLAANAIDREALASAITASIGDHEFFISSIELKIASNLHLAKGGGTMDGKDFEDALHLYLTFEGGLMPRASNHPLTDLR